MSIEQFPAINASLNFLATVFLLAGWWAIKVKHNTNLHRAMMGAALVSSALFLSCYLYYHFHTGSTRFQQLGFIRLVYFTILFTHIPLAVLMVPFILAAVWAALKGNFVRHKKIVKWVWPVWMYVSVTGVIIYVMLYKM